MKKALIDADLVVYRVGWTTEEESEGIAKYRADEMIAIMLDALQLDQYECYLTSEDKSNYRFNLYPDYKANRKGRPKPKHYAFLRKHLVDNHGAIMVHGKEADDALGERLMIDPEAVLCTIDKDMDQIAGWHYNFVKQRLYKISDIEARRCFYMQVLIGDKATDNVEGCPRIGEVKATRMLEGCQNETEMLEQVIKAYRAAYPSNEWADRLLLAGRLLWVPGPDKGWNLLGAPVSKMLLEHFFDVVEFHSDTKKPESNT